MSDDVVRNAADQSSFPCAVRALHLEPLHVDDWALAGIGSLLVGVPLRVSKLADGRNHEWNDVDHVGRVRHGSGRRNPRCSCIHYRLRGCV